MKRRLLSLLLVLTAAISFLSVPASAAGDTPAVSSNINAQDYTTYGKPVNSYLFENEDGGLTRVEYINGTIVAEDYSSSFQLLNSRTIPMELSIWGGFFAGKDYNFFVFGQENPSESNSTEVIRVVKYSKDWQRLGQASLRGANTVTPFDAGSLRMDEYSGYLYIRTCHTMYTYTDGLNHQANLMFVVRQSDMSVTDSFDAIAWTESGYVSHSFNQFILIDRDGYPVTLDHGDANPTRGVAFRKYYANASTGTFTGQQWGTWCSRMNLIDFGGSSGNNATGASIGGLAETDESYIFAFNYNGTGSGSGDRTVYLQMMDIATGEGRQFKINGSTGSTTPQLAPTGSDGGYLLWNGKNGYTISDTLYYLSYDKAGWPGTIHTASASLSDCAPIYYHGKTVWYTTDNSAPVFYTLDASGVTATPAGGSSQPVQPDPDPEEPVQPDPDPEEPVQPEPPVDPGTSETWDVSLMLAPSTITPTTAVKEDGTLWGWGFSTDLMGHGNKTDEFGLLYQDTPVQLSQGFQAAGSNWGIKEDQSLWFWGYELDPTKVDNSGWISSDDYVVRNTPVKVMDHVKQAYRDESETRWSMALTTDGTLLLWGYLSNTDFTPGLVSKTGYVPPESAIPLLTGVKQFKATSVSWMALKEDGSLWACGITNHGNLTGEKTDLQNGGSYYSIPLTKVMDGVAAFSLSYQNTLVIKQDGSLWSWGSNEYGQVGNGGQSNAQQGQDNPYQTVPVKILDDVIYAESDVSSFAITADGTLYGWGNNDDNQLGYAGGNSVGGWLSTPCQNTPKPVTTNVAAVVSGTRVLKRDGSLWTIGSNYRGTTGISVSIAPEEVTTLTKLMEHVRLPAQSGGSTPTEPEQTFSDLPTTHWAYPYVSKAAKLGWVAGTGNGQYSPSASLSNSQFLTMLTRVFFNDDLEAWKGDTGGQWWTPYCDVALTNGLVEGTAVGTSHQQSGGWTAQIDQSVSRYDMAQMMYNLLSDKGLLGKITGVYSAKNRISDWSSVPAQYQTAVATCYAAGLLAGNEHGAFDGESTLTRATGATVLCSLDAFVNP